ncbi:cellulose binding domain-containing protein, partial [Luedemannella helvata]|uniref:CBM2 domain-containing protein n=1 Tax=Luedemannella helvata TaxID=349315 RepID=A0ABP4X4H3_9ACTN
MATEGYQSSGSSNITVSEGNTPITSGPVTSGPVTSNPITRAPTSGAPQTTGGSNPGGGACTATYNQVNQWPGGFQGDVTVRAGNSSINGWTVTMNFGGGQTVTQLWNGVASGTSSPVTVKNASYNGSLSANGSTTFGFTGSSSGSASAPSLTCTSP